jgi:hypothetical protein
MVVRWNRNGASRATPSTLFDPDRELEYVVSRMRSSKVVQVLRHGIDCEGARGSWARADIDAAEIKTALPHVMITGISYHPFRVVYRLVGTEIVRWARIDFTNPYADGLVFDEDGRDWTDYYRIVVEGGTPGLRRQRLGRGNAEPDVWWKL